MRGILVLGITCFLIMVSPCAALNTPVINRPPVQQTPVVVATVSLAGSYITCPAGYECMSAGTASAKGYVGSDDTRSCGNVPAVTGSGIPEYCYRPSATTGSAGPALSIRPVLIPPVTVPATPTTGIPVPPVPVRVNPVAVGTVNSTGTVNATVPGPADGTRLVSLSPAAPAPAGPLNAFTAFFTRNPLFRSISSAITGASATDGCNGITTDFLTDADNCGACGNVCPKGPAGSGNARYCQQGECGIHSCSGGLLYCYGSCINPKTDTNNCGGCGGKVCGAGTTCTDGACSAFTSDAGNCGGSGIACTGNKGACCGSQCTDTMTDAQNCGGCGMVCSGDTPSCAGGSCVSAPQEIWFHATGYVSDQGTYLPQYSVTEDCLSSPYGSNYYGNCRLKVGNILTIQNCEQKVSSDKCVLDQYYHVELLPSAGSIPDSVKQEILTGKRKVFLYMYTSGHKTGSLTATDQGSELIRIAYNLKNKAYTPYIGDIPVNGDYGGTEIPPGQSTAGAGSHAHYDSSSHLLVVDISDIVRAWLNGSVENNGLKLMPMPQDLPQPDINSGDSSGFYVEYHPVYIYAVSAATPL